MIREAVGAAVSPADFQAHAMRRFVITDFGAGGGAGAAENTRIINELLCRASQAGGGTVVVPAGVFPVYTIRLQSDVTLHLEEGAVLRAARPEKEGGNYDEPEASRFMGVQDHGHTYMANSLLYGAELENIAITGPGVLDGSNNHDRADGEPLEYILDRWDPPFPERRDARGHRGTWFGNKGIALDSCDHIVLTDFTFLIGGHFALILSGCRDIFIDRILVDTIRDALDLDCCQDVTLVNSVFNSLNDDAICLKASFGAKKFMPVRNVLIEDCKVMGFDAGSVYAGVYARDKITATDRCRPTGRVKFGTEASCGCDTVTVRRVEFVRSRGLCLESCDTADMHDILVEDCRMREVSSSPIFIRLGARNRFPVTGEGSGEGYPQRDDVRLDNPEWVLPNAEGYERFPAASYQPSVDRSRTVSVDGVNRFFVPDPARPCRLNPRNYVKEEAADGTHYYARKWDGERYVPDHAHPIGEEELIRYGNACGAASGNTLARVWNITIRNITAEDVDPRYPILIHGLADSRVRNVTLENIFVTWRGGITMEMAVEQRQLNTRWNFSQFGAPTDAQIVPWLVNTFFAKSEGLLPRADWNEEKRCWEDDPYNVPELSTFYPEPSNYGILPAYGLYARHVESLTLKNVRLAAEQPDERHAVVLDDADGVSLEGVTCEGGTAAAPVALVNSAWRRPSGVEMVPELPYHAESVDNFTADGGLAVTEIDVEAPAPGTPPDTLYPYPTCALPENGYHYAVPTEDYPLPRGVYRPYALLLASDGVRDVTAACGVVPLSLTVQIRDPAGDPQAADIDGRRTGEILNDDRTVQPQPTPIAVRAFLKTAEEERALALTPDPAMANRYRIMFPAGFAERVRHAVKAERTVRLVICMDDGFREERQEILL